MVREFASDGNERNPNIEVIKEKFEPTLWNERKFLIN